MKNKITLLTLSTLLAAAMASAAENYTQWTGFRTITVNTTAQGAGVAATQTGFPVLVRLGADNFDFTQAAPGGADIRFGKVDGTPLAYQIESWDAANKTASIWVKLDVAGNDNTSFRLYFGKNGVSSTSNGAEVFSTTTGFQGAFHLGETVGDTLRDATPNGFRGVPVNLGGANPTDAPGVIGLAKNFLGSNANNNGGAYRLVTATGGNTQGEGPLNFRNSGFTKNGTGAYTISAWINADAFPTGIANRKGIVSKSGGVAGSQYQMRFLDPAVNQINSALDTNRLDFSDGPTAVYKNGENRLVPGTWYHVTAVRSSAPGNPNSLKVYVNGGNPALSTSNIKQTEQAPYDVYIGSFSNQSGFFSGKIDEVTFSSVARSPEWIKLAYETQKPGANVVAVGSAVIPPLSSLGYSMLTANYARGQAIENNMPVVAAAVTQYTVSPALPAGLVLNAETGIISGTPEVNSPSSYYVVTAVGPGGSANSTLNITVGGVTGIGPRILSNIFRLRLSIGSQLTFTLPAGANEIRFEMSDAKGRRVWNASAETGNGARDLSWQGKGSDGRLVPAGTYFLHVSMLDAKQNTLGSMEKKVSYTP